EDLHGYDRGNAAQYRFAARRKSGYRFTTTQSRAAACGIHAADEFESQRIRGSDEADRARSGATTDARCSPSFSLPGAFLAVRLAGNTDRVETVPADYRAGRRIKP